MIKVPVKLIRGLMQCQAKGDIREYLNGIYMDGKVMRSTNGHVALQVEFECDEIQRPMVIDIQEKIPASAKDLAIEMISSEYAVVHYDRPDGWVITDEYDGEELGFESKSVLAKIRDPKGYPDFGNIMPGKEKAELFTLPINIDYLSLPSTVFGSADSEYVNIELREQEKSPDMTQLVASCSSWPENILIVMPAKLDTADAVTAFGA